MKMNKTLLLASMALAAMAPAAQANVRLADPEGGILKLGAGVTLTGSKLEVATFQGTLACKKVTIHFKVAANGLEHVMLEQIGAAETKECSLKAGEAGVFPVTVKDWTVGVEEIGIVTINTWGTLNTNVTFISETFQDAKHEKLINRCHFGGKVHAGGATPESDILNVPGSLLGGSTLAGPECPISGFITGSFTLETPDDSLTPETDETPVFLDFEKTG